MEGFLGHSWWCECEKASFPTFKDWKQRAITCSSMRCFLWNGRTWKPAMWERWKNVRNCAKVTFPPFFLFPLLLLYLFLAINTRSHFFFSLIWKSSGKTDDIGQDWGVKMNFEFCLSAWGQWYRNSVHYKCKYDYDFHVLASFMRKVGPVLLPAIAYLLPVNN